MSRITCQEMFHVLEGPYSEEDKVAILAKYMKTSETCDEEKFKNLIHLQPEGRLKQALMDAVWKEVRTDLTPPYSPPNDDFGPEKIR